MSFINAIAVTYDHRLRRIGHPVRSAIHKPQIGRLVVGWVTTSEYLLLYVVFCIFVSSQMSRTHATQDERARLNLFTTRSSFAPVQDLRFTEAGPKALRQTKSTEYWREALVPVVPLVPLVPQRLASGMTLWNMCTYSESFDETFSQEPWRIRQ